MNYFQRKEKLAFTWVLVMELHFLIYTTMYVVLITKKMAEL